VVPEAGSLALLAAGLGGLAALHKLLRQAAADPDEDERPEEGCE
jgi:hypothetical protein